MVSPGGEFLAKQPHRAQGLHHPKAERVYFESGERLLSPAHRLSLGERQPEANKVRDGRLDKESTPPVDSSRGEHRLPFCEKGRATVRGDLVRRTGRGGPAQRRGSRGVGHGGVAGDGAGVASAENLHVG
jgi:hypothetical protein